MSDTVIKVENLGKKYVIGHVTQRGGRRGYTALRDVLAENVQSVWQKTRDLLQGKPVIQGDTMEEVWALKDINIEIHRGEAIGFIGRNGAGKSTLLKVLSRITEPTTGRVTIKGRVASLLEVGTGFHPELTGRENVYLNGAILGMTQREIKRKFDEIIAFAEVERYLDTPVKRYSSGMYVRLAFAVAAHLEPEILVVDEVLAVGDAEFQKKCLGKMDATASEGRTVLFVSHNMVAIRALCSRGVLLSKGRIETIGSAEDAISVYQGATFAQNTTRNVLLEPHRGDGFARIHSIRVLDQLGDPDGHLIVHQEFTIEITYDVLNIGATPRANFLITSLAGVKVIHAIDTTPVLPSTPGRYRARALIRPNILNNGMYTVLVAVSTLNPVVIHDTHEIAFEVHDDLLAEDRVAYRNEFHGVARLNLSWKTQEDT